MGLRAVFFDAGGTLVFPDRELTLAPLKSRGLSVTQEQLHSAERAARRYRDENASTASTKHTDEQYWVIYYQTLLGELAGDPQLLSELVLAARTSANWTFVPPEVRDCLLKLKQKYRLAVISNSDGRIADLLARLGLADLFETITDSGRVGHQKPSPIIFQAALQALNVPAEESVYVGDVYSIDYTGARAIGMQAILIDPYGTYASNGIASVETICEVEKFLEDANF